MKHHESSVKFQWVLQITAVTIQYNNYLPLESIEGTPVTTSRFGESFSKEYMLN